MIQQPLRLALHKLLQPPAFVLIQACTVNVHNEVRCRCVRQCISISGSSKYTLQQLLVCKLLPSVSHLWTNKRILCMLCLSGSHDASEKLPLTRGPSCILSCAIKVQSFQELNSVEVTFDSPLSQRLCVESAHVPVHSLTAKRQ